MDKIVTIAVRLGEPNVTINYDCGKCGQIQSSEFYQHLLDRIATLEHQVEMLSKPDDGETVTTTGITEPIIHLRGSHIIDPPRTFTVEEVNELENKIKRILRQRGDKDAEIRIGDSRDFVSVQGCFAELHSRRPK